MAEDEGTRRAATGRPSRRSRQDEIREEITRYIVENGLPAGSLLPTEQELMRELGVGRNALREAMKVLQALGIVQIRHGFGTYVGDAGLASLESGLHFRTALSLRSGVGELRNLLDVREALEVGLASRVVDTLGAEDTAALERIVQAMSERAAAGEYFPELDWRFHEALYAPLDNALVIDLLRVFWRVFGEAEADLPGARYTPQAAAGWHRDVLDAVISRDAAAVAAALVAHFADIRERLERA